jgi:hypothetical protein
MSFPPGSLRKETIVYVMMANWEFVRNLSGTANGLSIISLKDFVLKGIDVLLALALYMANLTRLLLMSWQQVGGVL